MSTQEYNISTTIALVHACIQVAMSTYATLEIHINASRYRIAGMFGGRKVW